MESNMREIISKDMQSVPRYGLNNNQQLKDAKILITGASGLIGQYLVNVLLTLNKLYGYNITIYGVVRNIVKAKNRFSDHVKQSNLILIQQDISKGINIDCEEIDYEEIDYIIHAASPANRNEFKKSKIGIFEANIVGTKNLLDFGYAKKCKGFLFVSSGLVSHETEAYELIEENCHTVGIGLYPECKRMGETITQIYGEEKKMRVLIARPFTIYGPGEDQDSGRAIMEFCLNAKKGRSIELNSNGKAVRSYCYVLDAAIALLLILLNGSSGEIYNIGNPNDILSIKELAECVKKVVKDKIKVTVNEKDEHQGSYYIPSTKKICQLGLRSFVGIEEGIYNLINSLDEYKGESNNGM